MKRSFEQLSSALMDVLYKVTDEESLLEATCKLLGARASLLVKRQAGDTSGTVLSVFPREVSPLFDNPPHEFWEWLNQTRIPGIQGMRTQGMIIENALHLKNNHFNGGLVAFGAPLPDDKEKRLELVALNGSQASMPHFLSYHTWISYNLLRQYEYQLNSKEVVFESNQKRTYSTFVSQRVLSDESWGNLNNRIKELENKDQGVCQAIWVMFQVAKIINNVPVVEELGFKSVYDELKVEESSQPVSPLIRFLVIPEEKRLLDAGITEQLRPLILDHIGDTTNSLNGQSACLFLSHAWWHVMQQAIVQTDNPRHRGQDANNPPPAEEDFCRKFRHDLFDASGIDLDTLTEAIRNLLLLTQESILSLLESDLFSCKENGLRDWGRDALRLYLAVDISRQGSEISRRYLDEKSTSDQGCAPEQLRRHFIVNLARFMISIMDICLKRHKLTLDSRLRLISPSEGLDSLLYMVDRYAHVELGVDPRLNIREMLGRQIAAEVHLHLSNPYYRDHLMHVIDVFLLGHLILNTELSWINQDPAPLVDQFVAIWPEQTDDITTPDYKERIMRNWAVVSLLHDIGYQIGHGAHLSSNRNIWESYFALNTTDGPSWLHLNQNDTQAALDSGKGKKEFVFLEDLLKTIRREVPSGKAMFPNRTDTITDHGMLSALKTAQVVLHADNHHTPDGDQLNSALIDEYSPAIHAIAFHNFHDHTLCIEQHPLACLLRLCDELQEWDRRRVNIEKVIKGLYLDIQEGIHEDVTGHDLLDMFCANIRISKKDAGIGGGVHFEFSESVNQWFRFQLTYKDAVTAQFDPTMTLLTKGFCFQNIDLTVGHDPTTHPPNQMQIMMTMQFPVPNAYGNFFEYDIYGMFTEEIRDLPLLTQVTTINDAPPGLVKLDTKEERMERFGIVLQGKSEIRQGRIPTNPGRYRDRFMNFKKKMLPHVQV